jgi:hypothetical protein
MKLEGANSSIETAGLQGSTILTVSIDELTTHVENCMRPAIRVDEQKLADSAQEGCRACAIWMRAIHLAKTDSGGSKVSILSSRKHEGAVFCFNNDGSLPHFSPKFYDMFTDNSEFIKR